MRDEVTIRRLDDDGQDVALGECEALDVAAAAFAKLAADELLRRLANMPRPSAPLAQGLVADAVKKMGDALGAELTRRAATEPALRDMLRSFAEPEEETRAIRGADGKLVAVRKRMVRP